MLNLIIKSLTIGTLGQNLGGSFKHKSHLELLWVFSLQSTITSTVF